MSVDLAELALSVDANGFVKADKTLSNFNKTANTTEKQAERVAKGMALASKAAGALLAALSVREIIAYSDAWTNVSNTLSGVTKSSQELVKTQAAVVKLAKETYSSLEGTAGLYSELTRSTSELGVSQDRILGVTRTINNLFLAGGKAASETAGAIRQLNQGLASGALRGDEFNSVAEGAPRILDALSKSLNISKGELRAFAATGGITSQILIRALEDYSTEAQKAVDTTQRTFSQNKELTNTLVTEYIGNMKALSDFTNAAGVAMVFFAENLGEIEDIVKSLAIAFSLTLIPVAYKYIAAQLLMNTASIRTVSALGMVTVTAGSATVAQNALALSSRAASAAMGLLGGPLGVITLAAGALIYFATKASPAEREAQKLVGSVNEAADAYKNLSNAKQALARAGLVEELQKQQAEVRRLQTMLSMNTNKAPGGFGQVKGTGKTSIEIDAIKSRLEDASKAADETAKKLAAIDGITLANAKKQIEGVMQPLVDFKFNLDSITSVVMDNADASWDAYKSEIERAKTIKDLNVQMEREAYLLSNTSKEAEMRYDIQKKIIKATGEEAQALINAARRLDEYNRANQETAEHIEFLDGMFKSINDSIDSSFAKNIYKIVDGFDRANDASTELQQMIKNVDDFGGAWSRTGSIIVDAFGSMADSLNDYTKRMTELAAQQKAANEFKPQNALEEVELEKLKIRLSQEAIQTQLSGYSKMAGAAASMFKEQSKGRKALNRLEQTFAAIEIALSIKKAAAAALVAVANQGQGDPYTAFARIAAMAAIMAGFGLAVGGGGGGSGPTAKDIQEKQGTGSVLGDAAAKSESLVNAFKDYQDIAIDQISELRGIRSAMSALSNGIAGLATTLVSGQRFSGNEVSGLGTVANKGVIGDLAGKVFGSSFADPVTAAILGSTKKSLKDAGLTFANQDLGDILSGNLGAFYYNTIETTKKKLFGLIKKSSTKDELTGIDGGLASQVKSIFGFIGSSVNESLKVLGIDAQKSINDFQISIGKISFKDLSGDEIQKELEAVFSQQADLLAMYILPQITQYQKMGEGAFETLTRVAKEQAVFNDAIDSMGISLGEISNIMRVDVAQSIITLMGGLEEFSEKTSAYFNAFYSDSEKLSALGGSLSDVFAQIDVVMPSTNAQFRAIVDSLDITTASGQELFATLMEIAPSFDQYTKALEKSAQQALAAVNASIDNERKLSQARRDAAKSVVELARAERDAAAARYSLAESALKASFDAEIEATEKIRDQRIDAMQSELDAAKNMQDYNRNAVNDARKALEDALSAEQKMRQDAISDQIAEYRKVASEAQAYANSLRSLSESLRQSAEGMGADSVERTLLLRRNAQADIEQALTAARGGNFDLAKALNLSALQNTDGLFSTRAERDFDIGVTQNKLAEIAKLADGQATIEEKAYAAAQSAADSLEAQTQQLSSINNSVMSVAAATAQLAEAQKAANNYDAIVGSLEAQIAAEKSTADQQIAKLQQQLDALIGNKEAVLTVDDAIKQFLDAKESLAIMDAQLANSETALAVAQSMYDAEIAAFDEIVKQQTDLYNSAIGIDTSIKSVDASIDDLSAILMRYTDVSVQQQQDIASLSNQQMLSNVQRSASEKILTDEIIKLRAENKDLQQKMNDSLNTIAENSTSQLNLARLNS